MPLSSDVEEELQKSALTWDDACKLAETWKRRHSQENLIESSEEESGEIDESSDDDENGYEELESENEMSSEDSEECNEEEESDSQEESSEVSTEDEGAGDSISTPKAEIKPVLEELSPQKISYGKESHPIALKSPEKIVVIDFEDEKYTTVIKEEISPQEKIVNISKIVTETTKEIENDLEDTQVKKHPNDKSEFKDLEIILTSKEKQLDHIGMMDPLTEKDLSFDLKFVTVRRKKNVHRTVSQDSESSLTESSPGSPKSSTSSQTLNMLEMEPLTEILIEGPVDISRQAPIAIDEIDETYKTESSEDTTSRPSSVLSLPDDKTPIQSPISPEIIEEKTVTDGLPKKKIPFDRSLLDSVSDVKEVPGDKTLEAEKGRKKIRLDSGLKKSEKMRKSIEDIDIPFADEGTEDNDSENEVFGSPEGKFYTPLTSKKPERPKDLNILVKVIDDGNSRISDLQCDDSSDKSPYILEDDKKRLYNNKRDKEREEARLRAKSKTDEELGLTPSETKIILRKSQQSNKSDDEVFVTPRTSINQDVDDDDIKKRFGKIECGIPRKESEEKSKDQETSECKESSDEISNDVPKSEKRKSLLAFLGLSSSDSKKKKKEESPSSTDSTPVEKRSKLPFLIHKDHLSQDKRKKKTQEDLDSLIKSKFYISDAKVAKKPLQKNKLENISTFKSFEENFSCTEDTEEELLDEKSFAISTPSRERRKQKPSEEDFQERLTRKVQKAAQRLQRQAEMKRLRMAQEIQRKLEEVAVRQQELGVLCVS